MIKIPRNVQSLLNASYHISTYKAAIEELVYNSLDAGATSIAIRVNIQESFIQAVDNGCGIKRSDFNLLGQRYTTSRDVDISKLKSMPLVYGYRGLSLASIIDVSHEVKIVSRFRDSQETWMKIFSKGAWKTIAEIGSRPSKGTTVDLKGFLYNLKIQREAVDFSTELLYIKTLLEQLSLVHLNVSFSLRDDGKNEIVFELHKNRDIFSTISSLFDIVSHELQELQVEKLEYKLKAFIGKRNIDFKKCQWIFLNRKCIFKSNIHKLVNKHLLKSLGIQRCKLTKKVPVLHLLKLHCIIGFEHNFNKDEMYTQYLPFYFLFISCPYLEYDVGFNSKKTIVEFKNWDQINNLLRKLVQCYCGDRYVCNTLKEITKENKTSNNIKQELLKNNEKKNTEEVKNIIEKILVNNAKKQKESKMYNGIAGKNIKRKRKIKTLKNFENKYKTKINSTATFSSKAHSTKLPKSDARKRKSIVDYAEKSDQADQVKNRIQLEENENYKQNDKLDNIKGVIDSDPIVKRFKDSSESLQERCKLLSEATKNMQLNQKRNLCEGAGNMVYGMNKNAEKTNVKMVGLCNIKQKELCNDKIYQHSKNAIMTSYDLLHTILKNVSDCTRNLDVQPNYKVTTNIKPQTTKLSHSEHVNRTDCNDDIFSTKSTYESHNYNLSRNKFGKNYSKNMHYASRGTFYSREKITSKFKSVVNKKKTGFKNKYFFNIMRIGLNDSLYTIEVSNSVKKFNFEASNIQCKSNVRFSYQSNNINKSFIEEIKGRCEKTYTIENVLSDYNQDLHKNTNLEVENIIYTLNESYEIGKRNKDDDQILNCNDRVSTCADYKNTNKALQDMKSDGEIISIFNLSKKEEVPESLDPLTICQTIIDATNESYENKIEPIITANSSLSKVCVDLEDLPQDNKKQETNNNNVTSHHFDSLAQEINEMFFDTFHFTENSNKQNDEIISENNESILNNDFNDFIIRSRHTFMPKGMSPISKKRKINTLSIHNTEHEYYDDEIYKNFAESVLDTAQGFEPKIQNINGITTNNINKVTNKTNKENADLIFDGQSIKQAKVLNQVDCKFIATIMLGKIASSNAYSDFLVLFDQHAVHERIRLEKILSEYFDGTTWKSVKIDVINLKLSKDDAFFLHNYKDKLTAFGLQWSITDDVISIYGVPRAILGNNARHVDVILTAVKSLLGELIAALKFLKGNIPIYPQSVMNLVFSEACRYAIMFGDKLSKSNCVSLLESLAECKTPFQCAHGRPVMAVIMEMDGHRPKYRVNFEKVKLFKDMDEQAEDYHDYLHSF